MREPLLVTGLPRTGTSWVGKMLEAGGEVVYVNEPLNPRHPPGHSPGVLRAEVTHRFQYICGDDEDPWLSAFTDTARLRYHAGAELRRNRRPYDLARLVKYGSAFTYGRLRGRRALLDDPYALLSAAWFARRLGATVVLLVRDPVAFAGSWQKLGWSVRPAELLDQPLLVRDLLAGDAADLRARAALDDPLGDNATLWRVAYSAVHRVIAREPGVHVVRYEDLSRRPVEAFAELYDRCGLRWTPRTRAAVEAATSGGSGEGSGFAWSRTAGLSRTAYRRMDSSTALATYRDRLSADEIARVRALTADVAALYYPDPVRS
jgi:hypothetical protein